ncbi:glutathione S-transferase family protein [Flavisphingomonas formosensis]|uniref:glutathione S-transferase family protein n=1 Tax=Flavisphingomonas formosensis TaxID=861534 RepID=UPI0012F71B5F|nr:glutathione S-transferase N-terminal domain-containing protein [Sphingomonas formosensis]
MTQDSLTLYGMGSPNVRKVGIMLEELGLAYELRHVCVFSGEQFDPAFQALNPLGKVPVLVDSAAGATIFESGAILFYLAERHGALLPAAGLARYETMQWLMVQMASIGPMFGQHTHFSLLPAGSEPYSAARYKAQAERLYRLLDDRLAVRDWIAGDAYSIADIATYPWALYLERHGFSPADHPALGRWAERIGARPAIARSAARFAEAFDVPTRDDIRIATPRELDRFFVRPADAPVVDYASAIRGG